MTLVVGILCKGGVVLGADGAATLQHLDTPTVRQPVRKLVSIRDKMILGGSGPVGVLQLFEDSLRSSPKSTLSGTNVKTPADAMRALSQMFSRDVTPGFERAAVARPVVGHMQAHGSVAAYSLVSLLVNRVAVLIQLDPQCSAETATENLPFMAIGSAQQAADSFLAMIRRVFWKNPLPNVAEGTFATYWTLHHVIETSPGGVSDPIQVMTLEDNRDAHELTDEELGVQRQMVDEAEASLREYGRSLSTSPPPSPP